MKILDIILILLYSLSFIKCTCAPEDEISKIRRDKDCKDRNFDETEIEEESFRCCFLRLEKDSIDFKGKEYSCIAITQEQFNNIKTFKKELENQPGIKKVKIDCKSTYFQYGLLFLFLLIF